MKIDYQAELNQEQYQVVTQAEGPCLVLAGAGSGKTRTLVYRVAYLLERGIKPENILLVTFTNKAAKEMIGRVRSLLGFEPQGLNAGTFHHIANLLLRHYADRLGYNRNFTIIDQDDSIDIIKAVMQNLNLNVKGQNFPKPNVVQSVISFARNSNEPISEVAGLIYGYPDFIAESMERIALDYQEKKLKANAMDFDDLLVNWLRLLREHLDVADHLSDKFKYILVDEYQDTNYIQAAVINALAKVHQNVLVVGDDAQSIYSFRAADINNILNFPKNFPNTKTFHIETNYRSTPQILALANDSISHNLDKYEKSLRPYRREGVMPILIPARDVYQQAGLIANKIIELMDKNVALKNIAVLFRAVYHSAELQLELARRNIPFIVRGGMRYFEQAHIKDIVSYLKIVQNIKDEIAWKRVLRLYDGIGPAGAEKIWQQVSICDNFSDLFNQPIKLSGARLINSWNKILFTFQLLNQIAWEKKGSLAEAVLVVLEHGYRDYLKNTFDNHKERFDDVQQFIDFVMTYESLEKLLSDVLLSEQFAHDAEKEVNSLVLSTIHQAKGLEWNYVMLLNLRDGDFPHYKSLENKKEVEEERRLFYVAITRAKDELYLFYPIRKNTFQYGEMTGGPSLFIKEVNEKYLAIKRQHNFLDFGNEEDQVIYYD